MTKDRSRQPGNSSGEKSAEKATTTPAKPSPTRGADAPPASWNSITSMIGLGIALSGIVLLITFGLFSIVSPASNPYVDIIGYMVIPGLIFLGLFIAIVGVFVRRWMIHRKDPDRKFRRFPRIDMNDPRQRQSAKYLGGLVVVMLPIVAVSSYHGYHYTDSVSFCAEACHEVMQPEADTFQFSSHARVTCAECHIGSGASWFVKAKISGIRQVLAVVTNSYSRPIPPAISHLRPAADTCEQCHWPQKFYGAQLKEISHYATDAVNTRREVRMLVKTGGGDEITGQAEGIHMHMLMSGKMEYVAADDLLQEIPWIQWTQPNGRVMVYRSDGRPFDDPRPEGQLRQIDCMDCHNRPAHKFYSPRESVDVFLTRGRIDSSLPFIKRESMKVLVADYAGTDDAIHQIADRITGFYRREYPGVWTGKQQAIEDAIERLQEIYRLTFFPRMRVDWMTYPDNIGHLNFPGCFRCHDGEHVNQYGDVISRDCHLCHDFLNPVEEGTSTFIQQGEFIHSYQLEGIHAELLCHQCHTGGLLDPTCTGCHADQQALYTGSKETLAEFDTTANPMVDTVDCDGCHDLAHPEPASLAAVDAQCTACHDEETAGMLAEWAGGLAAVRSRAEEAVADVRRRFAQTKQNPDGPPGEIGEWLDRREAVLRFLARANPLHNPTEAERIYEQIATEAKERARSAP